MTLNYPLLFSSIYKEAIWGGQKIKTLYARDTHCVSTLIGEAWEIVDRQDAQSIVENGAFAGTSLHTLVCDFKHDLFGFEPSFECFPWLVKIIDARERLSLQVHPNEEGCKKFKQGEAEPKTEMWYVLDVEKDAVILSGLKPQTTPEDFKKVMHLKTVEKYLQLSPSIVGESYFIRAGRVHAIGEGNLIFEIQQNSNTTFRLSDWGRVDALGHSRELHIDAAMKSIDFSDTSCVRRQVMGYDLNKNLSTPLVDDCDFFVVNELKMVETQSFLNSKMRLITAVDGDLEIVSLAMRVRLEKGRTALLPAAMGNYTLQLPKGECRCVLECSLP